MAPRHENKFVVDLEEGERFLSEIAAYCTYDEHTNSDGSYEVASIYYDTKNLQFFTDREESVAYRRKLRLRSYNKDGRSVALFFEIKEKHKNLVNKKRVPLLSTQLLQEYRRHDRLPIERVLYELPDGAVKDEIDYLNSRLHLFPVSIIRYVRKTLVARFDNNIRITLDRRITAGGTLLESFSIDDEYLILNQSKAILEIKSNGSIPSWLHESMLRHGFSWVRFSKYAAAIINGQERRGTLMPLADHASEPTQLISEKR